jgi:hypothetical protein
MAVAEFFDVLFSSGRVARHERPTPPTAQDNTPLLAIARNESSGKGWIGASDPLHTARSQRPIARGEMPDRHRHRRRKRLKFVSRRKMMIKRSKFDFMAAFALATIASPAFAWPERSRGGRLAQTVTIVHRMRCEP